MCENEGSGEWVCGCVVQAVRGVAKEAAIAQKRTEDQSGDVETDAIIMQAMCCP